MNIQKQLFSGISYISNQGQKVISTALQNKVAFVGLVALSFTIYKLGIAYKNQSQKPSGPTASTKPPRPSTPSPSSIKVNFTPEPVIAKKQEQLTETANQKPQGEEEKIPTAVKPITSQIQKPTAKPKASLPKSQVQETIKEEQEKTHAEKIASIKKENLNQRETLMHKEDLIQQEALNQKEKRLHIIKVEGKDIHDTFNRLQEGATEEIIKIKKMVQNNSQNPIKLPQNLSIVDYITAFEKATYTQIRTIQRNCINDTLDYLILDFNITLEAFKEEGKSPNIDPIIILNLIDITTQYSSLYENLIASLNQQVNSQYALFREIQKKYKEGIYSCEVPDLSSPDASFLLKINNKEELENLIKCYETYINKLDNLIFTDNKSNDCLIKQLRILLTLKDNLKNIN